MAEHPLQTHAGCAQDMRQSRSVGFVSVFSDYMQVPGDCLMCLVMLTETDMFDVQVKRVYLDCDQENIGPHVLTKNKTASRVRSPCSFLQNKCP
jgi:hypothetical protein